MPQESHYKAAIADDDELAELWDDDETTPHDVPLAGYSRVVQALDDLREELRVLRVEAVNTNPHVEHPAKFKPIPRPETAIQRKRERQREQKLSNLAALLEPRPQ